MYSKKALQYIRTIQKKIIFIENIVKAKGSIAKALEDEQNDRAAILMHLTSIAEQRETSKNQSRHSAYFTK
jgi:hypothetical protein